jgi:hypothetical protein
MSVISSLLKLTSDVFNIVLILEQVLTRLTVSLRCPPHPAVDQPRQIFGRFVGERERT